MGVVYGVWWSFVLTYLKSLCTVRFVRYGGGYFGEYFSGVNVGSSAPMALFIKGGASVDGDSKEESFYREVLLMGYGFGLSVGVVLSHVTSDVRTSISGAYSLTIASVIIGHYFYSGSVFLFGITFVGARG